MLGMELKAPEMTRCMFNYFWTMIRLREHFKIIGYRFQCPTMRIVDTKMSSRLEQYLIGVR